MFGFNKDKAKGKRLFEITSKTYSNGAKLLSDYAITNVVKSEFLPLLFVASDIACVNSNKDRSSVANTLMKQMEKIDPKLDSHQFQSRVDFYGEIMRGRAIRGDWLMGNGPSDNGLIRCVQAFGDLMYNPKCIKDYDGAPVNIQDISKNFQFATVIMDGLIHLVVDYYNQIYTFQW